METMTKEHVSAILKQDAEALYLGNLRTVEFDLELPTKGKYGSAISWSTKDDRFITTEGKVTRPSYGKGDRIIDLTATFTYGDEQLQRIYPVKVLEEENDVVIEEIYPIQLTKLVATEFYLPYAVAVRTEKNEVLSLAVSWEDEPLRFDQLGEFTVKGNIKDTDYWCEAVITIVEELETKQEREKNVLPFAAKAVRLKEGSMLKTAQDQRLAFLLSVDDDQMLYNFRDAAHLDTLGAPEMIGWDSPDSLLKGHTTGHYVSALALCYGATGDQQILGKLQYMIDELEKVQAAFQELPGYHYGFLSGYSEDQFDLLEEYTPYPQIWAPYYTLHKIFAGLLDAYNHAGLANALAVADKLGDWTYQRLHRLSHEQLVKMWGMYIAGEFGGMNESLAELYRLTQKPEHLQAAKYFDNDRLFFPMLQKIDALGALHANQHIPQVVGALKLYEVSQEDEYYQIADFFWRSVVSAHTYSIGGTGDGEMFQQPNLIASKLSVDTAETCASYNMLKLTKELFSYDPNVQMMDYYERTMLNHILATTDHDCGGESTYFMPTSPGAQRFFNPENSCCHGTGMENHFKYIDAIYYQSTQAIYINLFVASRLKDEATGTDLELSVDETHPENVKITVNRLERKLKIRKPYWSETAAFMINDQPVTPILQDGYYQLQPSNGDTVSVTFAIGYRFEQAPDIPTRGSIAYGPYILAVVDDSSEFIQCPETITEITKEEDSLVFTYGSHMLLPLAQIDDHHYHLYVEH